MTQLKGERWDYIPLEGFGDSSSPTHENTYAKFENVPKTHSGIVLKTHISIKMCEIKFHVTLHQKICDNESYAYAKLKKPLKLVRATF